MISVHNFDPRSNYYSCSASHLYDTTVRGKMNQHLILCSVCLVSSKFERRFKCRLGGVGVSVTNSIYEGLGTTVAEGEGGAGVGTSLDAL